MNFDQVSIVGLAHSEAPHRVTSMEIGQRLAPTFKRFGAGPDLIEALTGITARRQWDLGFEPSEAATLAAVDALEESGVDREKIGILINSSVCRDYIEPSTACLVHGNLKLNSECMNFDLGNACLGFVNAMEIVGLMIERGQIDYGMVVAGEGAQHIYEVTIDRLNDPNCDEQTFRDNFATLTIGSGGAAMVLARTDLAPDSPRLKGCVSLSATEHNRLCRGQPDHMVTDASALLVAGLELADKTYKKAGEELDWRPNSLDEYIIHQVSGVHTHKLCKLLGLDTEKVYKTYPEYGNVGPVNIPMTLDLARKAGRIKKGNRVGLLGIGSGLNCSMMELNW